MKKFEFEFYKLNQAFLSELKEFVLIISDFSKFPKFIFSFLFILKIVSFSNLGKFLIIRSRFNLLYIYFLRMSLLSRTIEFLFFDMVSCSLTSS